MRGKVLSVSKTGFDGNEYPRWIGAEKGRLVKAPAVGTEKPSPSFELKG